MRGDGVDVSFVRQRGRTGSIVVLVDESGERSFLTDPGSARDLDDPQPAWLAGVDVLHVPLYSLAAGTIATTARTLIEWARGRGIHVSVDVSSVSVIEQLGAGEVRRLLVELDPDAVFANADEARALGIDAAIGSAVTFVKAGRDPVTVFRAGVDAVRVPAAPIPMLADSTGAGDAFAAGVLTHPGWRGDVEAACTSGHAAAASILRRHAGPAGRAGHGHSRASR
jgi:sugar/nucleoside kinase (ribokinase family)